MHFSVIYFLKIVVDLFVSFGIFFSCLFSLFFFILFRHHPFRNHPFQDLSFSGIILFRTYPFRIFFIQNESFSGTILNRNLSIQIDFIFRNNAFQELSSTGNGSSTGICAAASDTKNLEVHLWRNHSEAKGKKHIKDASWKEQLLFWCVFFNCIRLPRMRSFTTWGFGYYFQTT